MTEYVAVTILLVTWGKTATKNFCFYYGIEYRVDTLLVCYIVAKRQILYAGIDRHLWSLQLSWSRLTCQRYTRGQVVLLSLSKPEWPYTWDIPVLSSSHLEFVQLMSESGKQGGKPILFFLRYTHKLSHNIFKRFCLFNCEEGSLASLASQSQTSE